MIRVLTIYFLLSFHAGITQQYPQNYFRSPINIPMSLVANFGEIRPNHWHMGLDIRTNHKVNLPVYASADGYISRVSVEAGSFGQAIYIDHPNGYTTLYGHLNAFYPELAAYVKQQQYKQKSWAINLIIPPKLFPVKKGGFIALSGSTGASEGPHVHFEIRDTRTGKNLNPLLFGFPINDQVPPTITKLALYNRNVSTYEQKPKIYAVQKKGKNYELLTNNIIKTNTNKLSFAIAAYDRFTNSNNPNGIYSAKISIDGKSVSEFVLNDISYDDTRYINAQIDYHYKNNGGSYLQHISPLPGDKSGVYNTFGSDGIIYLKDARPHLVVIEVSDANNNISILKFIVQYEHGVEQLFIQSNYEKLLPNNLNVIEKTGFEFFTTENSIYDTVKVEYNSGKNFDPDEASPVFTILNSSIPVHDSITIRIQPNLNLGQNLKTKLLIKNISGKKTYTSKGIMENNYVSAKFRQFGSFQVIIDNVPPTINSPGPGIEVIDLSHSNRIVFIPKDNNNSIKSFDAEVDGHWLCFTNDKGHSWIYIFDEHFPPGLHELQVTVTDEAGNETKKAWKVKR